MKTTQRTAFTLVEVLIVIVIMAVLAAVVVPQFTGSTDDAKDSTAEFNLSAFRSVMQTYRAHHNGATPALDTGTASLPGLTNKTTAAGVVDNTSGTLGPYLDEMPENPFTGSNAVKAAPAVPPVKASVTSGGTGGWMYDASSGRIWLDSDVKGEFAW